jgi:hypothetical protein
VLAPTRTLGMTLDELKATIEAEALRRQAARDGFTLTR